MKRLIICLLLGACHSSPPFVTAAHSPLPIVDGHQMVVLGKPAIVTVTFPGYTHKDKVEAWGDFIGGSSWLHTVGAEYGVGPGTQMSKIVWPTAAPAMVTDQELRMQLVAAITAGTLPPPPASNNQMVYVVYIPSGTVLDATAFGAGVVCLPGSFHSAGGLFTAGYHAALVAPNGTSVPYVVIGDCSNNEDEITGTASRELIGACTNPYESDESGYLFETDPSDPWILDLNNGEVGYLCSREPTVQEGGYTLNRSWSNAAAAASQQPCVPSPAGEIYANLSASPATMITAAKGSTLSFTLTGWSTADTPSWSLILAKPEGADLTTASLSPALSKSTISNGETATLTMTVPSTALSGQVGGVNVLSGPAQHTWPVGFTVK